MESTGPIDCSKTPKETTDPGLITLVLTRDDIASVLLYLHKCIQGAGPKPSINAHSAFVAMGAQFMQASRGQHRPGEPDNRLSDPYSDPTFTRAATLRETRPRPLRPPLRPQAQRGS